ncbi:MAG: hypothetical protein IT309_04100 [Anaerolineales bacterium]|nr:hypothetical protein [Anaerolineales bacterium]
MADEIKIGERVQVRLNVDAWGNAGWFNGTVIRIDPYSAHRSFTWVKLDTEFNGQGLISVLNPKNIRKI